MNWKQTRRASIIFPMEGSEVPTLKRISEQYNRYPYPKYSWMAKLEPRSSLHATYESGASLVHHRRATHDGKKIALLGCGTFEPYAMGTLHPRGSVSAVDLSAASLKKARKRCLLHWTRNVSFHQEDLISFCQKHPGHFDYIHSFGVLHHLEDPRAGFEAVARALKKDGFARIMVYSSVSRRRLTQLRRALLGFGAGLGRDARVEDVHALVNCLPHEHPLWLTFQLNGDHLFPSGIVDSLLHAQDHGYEWHDLLKLLDETGLRARAFDFSQNILNLLALAEGADVNEKIRWLESFDQWPTSFCFWVGRSEDNGRVVNEDVQWLTHPSLKKIPKGFIRSTLLKKNIELSNNHRSLLLKCARHSQPRSSFPPETMAAAGELVSARLLLEVAP